MNKNWKAGVAVAFAGCVAPAALLAGVAAPQARAAEQAAATKALPPISLDLRDAPIRQALEQLFNSAGVQFSIDNGVAGFITLRIQDQPFESALRLIMRASSVPLTYTVENGVYFVKPRPAIDTTQPVAPPPPVTNDQQTTQHLPLEQIQLTYADPYDLQGILQVAILTNMNRGGGSQGGGSRGGSMGSMGGMMGGMGGGMMGGMGGMGGGMMGGMGGGMMGGMGSMGGMSMGGMGGGMGGGFR